MLPIAVFPAAALLMGIGYALEESGMEKSIFYGNDLAENRKCYHLPDANDFCDRRSL